MWPRIVPVATTAIAATVICILLACSPSASTPPQAPAPPPPQSAPAPLLSPAFSAASKDVLEIEPAEALQLEQRLAAQPRDEETRTKLMAYWRRADQSGQPDHEVKRWRQALWLIEHQPDSEILHSNVAQFSPNQHTTAEVRRAAELWEAAVRAKAGDAVRLWNAAWFFQELEPGLHLAYLEATATADPNHPHALLPLAQLYADALRAPANPLAARAKLGLERSKNVWVLGNAAYFLQLHYNQTVLTRAPDRRLAELAERYFARAQAIIPSLDRQKILPRADPGPSPSERAAAEAKQQALLTEAERKIRRLPLDAFPQLPATVAKVLRSRKCTVPQPDDTGARNVIRGEFIARGEMGWALLCSVNESSTLLVFRNDADEAPQALATSEDRNYLQGLGGDKIGFSHEITAVDRAFILRHYRVYGGPPPPPIDHHGIDDAFLGKASATSYYHAGRWLQLRGAD